MTLQRYCVLFVAFLLAGCGGAGSMPAGAPLPVKPAGLSGKIVITGASTIAPLCSEIGKKFEALHPDVRVDIQTGGSSRGISDSRSGVADIGMVSRPLKPDESDLKSFVIAYDGVCVILHKDNTVSELSDEQVASIYTGKITNWKGVGGKDAPITVINKAEGRSTLELFCQHYSLKNRDIKPHVIIGDNEQGIKTVAGNPDSICYVSIGTAEFSARMGVSIKLLPIKGVEPTMDNVKHHKFPLSRPLNLVTKTDPEGVAKAFIEFATSKDVNRLIKEQFFVPVKE